MADKTGGPVLVVMAAGLGSRFKGLKQIQPVDDENHILMDYAVYDALEVGFSEVFVYPFLMSLEVNVFTGSSVGFSDAE